MKPLKNLFKPDSFKNVEPKETWEFAQRILDQFIEENGVKLHGFYCKNGPTGAWTTSIVASTHTGILLDIQPLKQCEHREAVYVEDQKETWFKCRDCGKPVKAVKWEKV